MSPKLVPVGYVLSKTYKYAKEVVHIYTDGIHYVFAAGTMDAECGLIWQTVSAPTLICNEPL